MSSNVTGHRPIEATEEVTIKTLKVGVTYHLADRPDDAKLRTHVQSGATKQPFVTVLTLSCDGHAVHLVVMELRPQPDGSITYWGLAANAGVLSVVQGVFGPTSTVQLFS